MIPRMVSHPRPRPRTLKLGASPARLAGNLFPTETRAPEPSPPSIGMHTSSDGGSTFSPFSCPSVFAHSSHSLALLPVLLLLPSPLNHMYPPPAPLPKPFLPGHRQSADGPSVQKRNVFSTFALTLMLPSLNPTVSCVHLAISGSASAQTLPTVPYHGMLTARAVLHERGASPSYLVIS